MTELRLSPLALMHIHYEFAINLDDVVIKFAEKNPRRMQLSSVLRLVKHLVFAVLLLFFYNFL